MKFVIQPYRKKRPREVSMMATKLSGFSNLEYATNLTLTIIMIA